MPSTLSNFKCIQDFGAFCGDGQVAIREAVAPLQGQHVFVLFPMVYVLSLQQMMGILQDRSGVGFSRQYTSPSLIKKTK
jgi:hypothetical protein